MTGYIGVGLAVAAAVGIAALLGPVLRALPLPPEPCPDYAALATRRFIAATAGIAMTGGIIVAWRDPHPWLWLPLVAILVPACAIDARTTYLPLRLTQAAWAASGLAVVLAALAAHDSRLAVRACIGALTLGVAFFIAWRLGAIGFGDVRLMISVGAVTAAASFSLLLTGLLAGASIGAAWGLLRLLLGRGRGPFAYGPALLAGPFVALAAGAT